MKVSQNVHIDQKTLAAIQGEGQKVQIIVQQNNYTASDKVSPDKQAFMDFIDSLPEPRINNMILQAMVLAYRLCGGKQEAANWLGVSEKTIHRYVSEGKPFEFDCRHSGNKQIEDGSKT